jgi:hypothetical protein
MRTFAAALAALRTSCLALALASGALAAEEAPDIDRKFIPAGHELEVYPSGRPIRQVQIADEKVVRRIDSPWPGQRGVVLRGLAPGTTLVTVTDASGKRMVLQVVVRREVTLPPGVTYRLQRSDRKALRTAVSLDERICRLERPVDDETLVYLHAAAPGATRVTLTDREGAAETHDIFVRAADVFTSVGQLKWIFETRQIRTMFNECDDVVHAFPSEGAPGMKILGLAPGVSRVDASEPDGRKASLAVGVRPYGHLSLAPGVRHSMRMYRSQPVKKTVSADETLAHVRISPDNPRTVLVEARNAGGKLEGSDHPGRTVQLTLTGADGAVEEYELLVRNVDVLLHVGGRRRFQLPNRRPITEVNWWQPIGVVDVAPIKNDPTSLEVTAVAVGVVRVGFTDEDGRWQGGATIGVAPATADAPRKETSYEKQKEPEGDYVKVEIKGTLDVTEWHGTLRGWIHQKGPPAMPGMPGMPGMGPEVYWKLSLDGKEELQDVVRKLKGKKVIVRGIATLPRPVVPKEALGTVSFHVEVTSLQTAEDKK